MSVEEAARRLLERASAQRLHPEGVLIMAAAGAIVEADESDAAFQVAERMHDRGLALLVTAAAEMLNPAERQNRLIALAGTIPSEDRVMALACAECFLARIGPTWAAALVEKLIGVKAIYEHGALGLCIAAQADKEGLSVPSWVTGSPDYRPLYARQLAADSVARAVVRKCITDMNHPALSPLHETPPGRYLLPTEASAYLAAAVVLDPAWALDVADGLLETHAPSDLEEALYLAAKGAVQAGMAERVATFASRTGFISEQACWIQAAARSGALDFDAVLSLVLELAPRVADELDTDRELIAGMPLLMALAYVGATKPLIELAVEWRTPPPLIADRLFHGMARHSALELLCDSGLDRLFQVPEDDWNATYECLPGWWLDAGSDELTRLSAFRDTLALAASVPWKIIPGSIMDISLMRSY